MQVFKMYTTTGERVAVPGAKRFSHYINGFRYWFAYHRPNDFAPGLTVSHWDSGMKVCSVSTLELNACRNDPKDAAKYALDKLCERVGAARVQSKLRKAESPKQPVGA